MDEGGATGEVDAIYGLPTEFGGRLKVRTPDLLANYRYSSNLNL